MSKTLVYVVLTTYDRDSYDEPSISVHETHSGAQRRVLEIEAEFTPSEISAGVGCSIETCELEE